MENKIIIKIVDDGCGMEQSYASQVTDPFTTERTTRSVGLGLPMFKATAERCSGSFKLYSKPNKGTEVIVELQRDHIDCPPIGDMADTMVALLCNDQNFDIVYKRVLDEEEFVFDTREVREQLQGVSIGTPNILKWIHDYLVEHEEYFMQKGALNNEISG